MQALQTCKGTPDNVALKDEQTLIWCDNGQVCIRILRRKNKHKGSGVLKRKCCCRGDLVDICPLHTLWNRFFCHLPCGAEPWAQISPKAALARLRQLLHRLGSTDADRYGTHDFRRGHAEACLRARSDASWPFSHCARCVARTCVAPAARWLRTQGRPVAQHCLPGIH